MKTYAEWFYELRGCSEEQFKLWCLSNMTDYMKSRHRQMSVEMADGVVVKVSLYGTAAQEVDNIIAYYRKRYMVEMAKEYLDQMELTFAEWLEGYYGLTADKLHEQCEQTGTSYKEECAVMEWYMARYQERVNLKELESRNPFNKQR